MIVAEHVTHHDGSTAEIIPPVVVRCVADAGPRNVVGLEANVIRVNAELGRVGKREVRGVEQGGDRDRRLEPGIAAGRHVRRASQLAGGASIHRRRIGDRWPS